MSTLAGTDVSPVAARAPTRRVQAAVTAEPVWWYHPAHPPPQAHARLQPGTGQYKITTFWSFTLLYLLTYMYLVYLVNQSLCPLGVTPKFFLNELILGAVTVLLLRLFHESTTRWAKKFFATLVLICTLWNFSWWSCNLRVGCWNRESGFIY